MVGKKEHRIGKFNDGTVCWDKDILTRWESTDVSSFIECSSCKYALLCGGGCLAHNLNKHYCVQMGDLIKSAIQKAYINKCF